MTDAERVSDGVGDHGVGDQRDENATDHERGRRQPVRQQPKRVQDLGMAVFDDVERREDSSGDGR
ncbi:MAG: hypothetical protein ACRCTX_15360 [Afipia sp.]